MMRLKRFGLAAAVAVGVGTMGAMGQMSIEPPAPAATQPSAEANVPASPAPTSPPQATQPGAEAASTMPSAQSVLEGLLKDRPTEAPAPQETLPRETSTSRTAAPVVAEAAPSPPKTTRIREGEFVWLRTGRLVKDAKTGKWFFAFDADGKAMQDPPMELIPSRLLMAMEGASNEGTQPTRFKVSGEVTEYQGKNYLWVQRMEIVKDLNKGIGG